jgi:phenylacetate-CoA ligase
MSRFFEVVNGTLVVTGDNGVPLIRYHIADRGGICSFAEMIGFLETHGSVSLEDYGLQPGDLGYSLPFVWVFGRADFTVSFYGANIYPENVVVGLEQPETRRWVSGKFVMETRTDAAGTETLQIAVELLPGLSSGEGLEELVGSSVRRQLLRLNSEFANYVPTAKQQPSIELRPFADPEFFPVGVKHRYTRR